MESPSQIPRKSGSEIEALIRDFLANSLSPKPIESLSSDSNLFTEGYLDSIGIMKLITHLESQLEIKIPSKDLIPKNFLTIQAMLSYLENR